MGWHSAKMRGGSSERLVVRAHRRRGDTRAKLTRYITVLLATLLGGGASALLFLVPLYADPALSALAADFDPLPAECVTERRDDRLGLDNCTWASCREGCTSDAYKCIQLHVKYKPHSEPWRPAVLFVNIKGCGYPPIVDCENFTTSYGYVGARYPCFWLLKCGNMIDGTPHNTMTVLPYRWQLIVMSYYLAPYCVLFSLMPDTVRLTNLKVISLCLIFPI